MGSGVRGVRLVILFFLALALCTVPFGESGCVFVDREKTGPITFEAWCSECRIWTTEDDFEVCVREDVDVNSQPGNVTLVTESIGTPVEPMASVGTGYWSSWSEPGATSYAAGGDAVLPAFDQDVDHRDASPDQFADQDRDPGLNATALNASSVDVERGSLKVPDDLVDENESGNGETSGVVSTSNELQDHESIPVATAGANATAANFTTVDSLSGDGEASPLNCTAGEEEGDNDDPIEVAGENKSTEGFFLSKTPDGVSADDDDPPGGAMAAGGGTWKYCAPITITNPGDVALDDYQVRVEVPYQWGMQHDFRDIRFTDDITGPLLPHWCDGYSLLGSAVFWVRVPSIPADGTTIYLHYRNNAAESASDGEATFLFYDDFEDYIVENFPNGWTKEGNFDVRVVNNGGSKVLRIDDNTGERGYLYRDDQNWSDVAVRERFKFDPSSTFLETIRAGVIARFVDGENYISGPVKKEPPWQNSAWVEGYVGGQHWFDEPLEVPGGATGWHTEELGLFGQRADLYIDDTLLKSVHLPADTPSSGKTGFFVQKWSGYRDEHIVRRYSPVYEGGHYLSPGTITSDVLDTTANDSKWDSLAWTASIPAETNISFEVRASNANFSYNNATLAWTPVGNISPVSTNLPSRRYLQWRANLSTDDTTVTPVLQEVRVWYTPGGY
ncbi:DUF2341 domain-containing protein [Methanofollis formosanus]|uniref:DUF2341 domain-containing protein n=1 Tax=Methanofollis formosanus TaxID=299308 RepID=A0A8G1EG54_9EURY|nr:DUF2341 domain-containing protein [Methanofollis formosanus]QYZ78809.1 DUF2341 domain-containing protein [Methanofollis formosanus]